MSTLQDIATKVTNRNIKIKLGYILKKNKVARAQKRALRNNERQDESYQFFFTYRMNRSLKYFKLAMKILSVK